ncbi:mating-type protein [Coprinopsis marcescibilis]|uniref:Mating-type protein n=1 Tax=Coprinopsis marcescibilis TaxID=230819 RepID=A0A5C3LE17_COPMA|nr:mating-type protein [Coprinopsis marcescibilis]
MDSSIQNTIRDLEAEFFDALTSGPAQLSAFEASWASFGQKLEGSNIDKLSTDTIDMLMSLTATISAVSSDVLDCEAAVTALDEELCSDVTQILDHGLVTNPAAQLPAYIEPSNKWLCANLHNPYPSQAVREHISRETNSSRKVVDAWFVDMRKRIGWNALRKEHFNKRADIIEAATLFFEKNEVDSLSVPIQLRFAAIASLAQEQYSAKLDSSSLAAKLDSAVKDMTPELKIQIRHDKDTKQKKAPSYPTPAPSPDHNSVPLSPASSTSSVMELLMPQFKRKRHSDSGEEQPVAKRTRCDSSDMIDAWPSPALSLGQLDETESSSGPAQSQTTLTPPPVSSKRKRRLSESDGSPYPKRPQSFNIQPRPIAVSGPLPTSNLAFDSWFVQLLGGTPPPVTDEVPDPSAPLDIQISNWPSDFCLSSVIDESSLPSTISMSTITPDPIPDFSSHLDDSTLALFQSNLDDICETSSDFQFDEGAFTDFQHPDAMFCSVDSQSTAQPDHNISSMQTAPTGNCYTMASVFQPVNPSQANHPVPDAHAAPFPLSPLDNFWETTSTQVGPSSAPNFSAAPVPTIHIPATLPMLMQYASVPALLSPSEKEAKHRELLEAQAKVFALYAELAAAS